MALLRKLPGKPNVGTERQLGYTEYRYRSSKTGRMRTGRKRAELLSVTIPGESRASHSVPKAADWRAEPHRLWTGTMSPTDEDTYTDGYGLSPKRYWLFRDAVYVTTEQLTPQEVKALALQEENRKKAKLAAAVALMDHVEQLSEHGRREPIPDDVKLFVWQRDRGACISCGARSLLEFDHIIPVTMGGSDTARNLQLLCEPCNRMKSGNLV